jgi:hypothetical protein
MGCAPARDGDVLREHRLPSVTEFVPDAVLFRNRSGGPYRADTLGDDFASVRELAFPGDMRGLMDMRRSGVVEAIAGDVGPLGLSAKLRSGQLHRSLEHPA